MEFLSDEQAATFGRFVGEPSRPELERFFLMDQVDAELVGRRRGDHNRLRFAVQLGTVRFLGGFLPDPVEVPWVVVDHLAAQLGLADSSVVKLYAERAKTHLEHAWEIRAAYGYRDFSDPDARQAHNAGAPTARGRRGRGRHRRPAGRSVAPECQRMPRPRPDQVTSIRVAGPNQGFTRPDQPAATGPGGPSTRVTCGDHSRQAATSVSRSWTSPAAPG